MEKKTNCSFKSIESQDTETKSTIVSLLNGYLVASICYCLLSFFGVFSGLQGAKHKRTIKFVLSKFI